MQTLKGRLIAAAEETAAVEGGVVDLQVIYLIIVAVEFAGEGFRGVEVEVIDE